MAEDLRIMLVEDEGIEALDIKKTLESFGYQVPYISSYGEEAILKAQEIKPDLILMDIVLKGKMDGIAVASEMKNISIPVIFLTAHSEESEIERAKLTEHYGYVIKPFEPMNLKNAIDFAIFKFEMENKLKAIIQGSPIPQFVLDKNHRVIYWNKALEKYSGIKAKDVIGTRDHWKPFYNEKTPCLADLLLNDMANTFANGHSNKFTKSELLEDAYQSTNFFPKVGEDGKWLYFTASLIKNSKGKVIGAIETLEDVTQQKKAENQIKKLYRLYATLSQINQSVVRIKRKSELFKKICDVCIQFGEFQMALISEIDFETGNILPVEYCGIQNDIFENFSLNIYNSPDDHPTIRAIKTGELVIIESVTGEPKSDWQDKVLNRNFNSMVSIPLKLKGKVIATLNIYSSEINFFTDEELDLVKEMALDISFALDSMALQKEHREFESALIESERNYRELVDYSMVGIYKTNLKGEIQFANQAMVQMFHYNDITDLKSRNIINLYKNDSDRLELISKLKEQGFVTDYEVDVVCKDGEILNVLVSASLNGEILSGMFMDISARKKAEKDLRQSEEKFRSLIFNSSDLIRILDNEGLIIFDSPSSERILGYPKDYFLGKDPLDYMHPDDLEKVKLDLEEVYQNQNPGTPTEFRILKSDGTYLPVETIAQNMMDVPGVNGVVVTTHPIHQRKLMEEALRYSEEKYRTLFESDPDYTVLVGLDGIILDVNKSTLDFTGLSKEKLVGSNFTTLYLFMDEDEKLQLEKFSQAVRTHQVQSFQCKVFNKEGGDSWIESKLVPLEKNGQIQSILVIATDITERKIAADKLESSLKEKEILLKEIHHRVKNNMQIISSLLNLQTKHVDEEIVIDVLKESQNRVKSMAMIHEKLYQSKDFTNINFKDYIQRLVSELFYSYNVDHNQIQSLIMVEDVLLNIETAVPCGLIISELVSNSLKHAFPDGRKGKLIISLKFVDEHYELIIEDNGVGMPNDLDYQNTDSLGLQLVNSLVNQIDGQITLVKSEGTHFRILFKGLTYKERF